jgi:eukaryotic-like serine/threonine-protein kinase
MAKKVKRNLLDMKYYKEVFNNVVNAVVIKPEDSDVDRAKKIIWYVFFGSIVMLCVVSWIIFVLLTFTTDIVKVPNVRGDNIYAALRKISEKKLVANVSPRYSETIEEGLIFNQNPSQGMLVKEGRSVTLTVSLGSQKKSLPDFTGMSFFEISNFLAKEFPNMKTPFKIAVPVYEFNNRYEKDKIFKQEPKEGTQVRKVKEIKFWVSKGRQDQIITNLRNYEGKNAIESANELADLEITFNFVIKLTDDKSQDMIVTKQSIPPGVLIETLVSEDKTVILTINKYKELNDEKILGISKIDLPKKPFPVFTEIKFRAEDASEKVLLSFKSKGGVEMPVPYTKSNGKIVAYMDGKVEREVQLVVEKK